MLRVFTVAALLFIAPLITASPTLADEVLARELGQKCSSLQDPGKREVCTAYVGSILFRYQVADGHAQAGRPAHAVWWVDRAHYWLDALHEDVPEVFASEDVTSK